KPERAAQIHHAQARRQELRRQFQRSFVRGRQKYRCRAARRDRLDRKSAAGSFSPSAQLRKNLAQAARRVGAFPQVECRSFAFRVPQQKPGQLETCIAGGPYHGDPSRVAHRSMASSCCCTAVRAALEGVTTKTVSSPPMVPATPRTRSLSSAAASG